MYRECTELVSGISPRGRYACLQPASARKARRAGQPTKEQLFVRHAGVPARRSAFPLFGIQPKGGVQSHCTIFRLVCINYCGRKSGTFRHAGVPARRPVRRSANEGGSAAFAYSAEVANGYVGWTARRREDRDLYRKEQGERYKLRGVDKGFILGYFSASILSLHLAFL